MDIIAGGVVGISQIAIGHPLDTIKVLIQNKQPWRINFVDYYRGSTFPFVCSILFNSTVFPIYNRSFEYTQSHFLSGAIGGFLMGPMVHYFDVAKIKRQTNQSIHFKTKGIYMSCLRETMAVGIYFGMYEMNKKYGPLISGGLAGTFSWMLTYPIDTIRSRQISQNKTLKMVSKKSLWNGLCPCLMRAFLVNSVSFFIFEQLSGV